MNDFDIAITGIACRFPGAKNKDEYWNNLKNGIDSIRKITDEELEAAGINPDIYNREDYVKAVSTIEDIELFDAGYFRYSPKEAAMIDPQHRIFLELSVEALEDAGFSPEKSKEVAGVFSGSGFNTYLLNNILKGRDLQSSSDNFFIQISSDKDNLSTRVSYKLDLKGPSLNIQTSCSTSLVAVHYAMQSLLNYECDVALAGGVSVRVPKAGYFYQEEMISSDDGSCRPFDKDAKGTVFGSGAGVVVLKRLKDAIRDNDPVICVIKGSAVNNDGAEKVGYTAPGSKGQQRVIEQALAIADIPVSSISSIEAHGTGTLLGDPIEFEALRQTYGKQLKGSNRCAIGSVKSNIGHVESAAGIASLIKMALCLKNKQLVPTLHFKQPNEHINLSDSPFYVNTKLREWENNTDEPLRCGVSSFGIGGTNAHIIMEESNFRPDVTPSEKVYHLLPLSAQSTASLAKQPEQLKEFLEKNKHADIADIAYSLCMGRTDRRYRKIIIAKNLPEIIDAIQTNNPAAIFGNKSEATCSKVVFMFPGQGSQYVDMARGIYKNEKIFREEVDKCADILFRATNLEILPVLFPDDTNSSNPVDLINQTRYTQPILFVIEYALSKLLISWGIEPYTMIGHSVGEYVAACLCGVFSPEDALFLISERGRLINNLEEGDMCAVNISPEELKKIISESLSVAAANGPDLMVVSGEKQSIQDFTTVLDQKNISYRKLHTSHAFHSAMMDPVLDEFRQIASKVHYNQVEKPFISNLTGKWIQSGTLLNAEYWTEHIRNTVLFSDGIQEIIKEEDIVFIEVGPGSSLSGFIKAHDHTQHTIPCLPHAKDDTSAEKMLVTALGKLWMLNIPVDWSAYYRDEKRARLSLPVYPFNRQKYWIEPDNSKKEDRFDLDSTLISQSETADETINSHKSPVTETQTALAGIFSSVLGIRNIGIDDNFFELGGHSLLATKLLSIVNRKFEGNIKLQDFFKTPTIESLSMLIDTKEENGNDDRVTYEFPALIKDENNQYEPFPLTEMQQAQWLGRISSFSMGNVAAHVYFEVDKKDMDPNRISLSWQKMIDRHDMLRTVLLKDGGQKVFPPYPSIHHPGT